MHAMLQISGEFNITACDDCPKKEDCGAFEVFDPIRATFSDQVLTVRRRYDLATEKLALDPSRTGRRVASEEKSIADTRFRGLLQRAEQIQRFYTEISQLAINAQLLEDVSTRNADIADALTKILRGIGMNNGNIIFKPEQIDKAGLDMRYYASTGICGALDIDES